MKRAIRLLITLPPLLLLVLFALSNRQPARLSLWPTDFSLELPLSLAILCTAALAFLCGGLLVWITAIGQRRRARHAEETVRLLEAQVQELKVRLASPISAPHTLLPPAAPPPS